MKRIILFLFAIRLMLPAVAQNNKALEKALKKEYKVKMKEFKKEGWKIFGSTRSLDVALLQHYQKLAKDGEYNVSIPFRPYCIKQISQSQSIRTLAYLFST